jgi:hypothetical protein
MAFRTGRIIVTPAELVKYEILDIVVWGDYDPTLGEVQNAVMDVEDIPTLIQLLGPDRIILNEERELKIEEDKLIPVPLTSPLTVKEQAQALEIANELRHFIREDSRNYAKSCKTLKAYLLLRLTDKRVTEIAQRGLKIFRKTPPRQEILSDAVFNLLDALYLHVAEKKEGGVKFWLKTEITEDLLFGPSSLTQFPKETNVSDTKS